MQRYGRDECEYGNCFQPVLFFSSAWIKDAPCLPQRWKLLSAHCHLLKKGIHFHLCAWKPHKHTSTGNPHTDHPPMQPFFPSPLPFSQLKSPGPRRPGLRAGQSAACRSRGLGGRCRDAHFAMSARSACEPPDPRKQTKPVLRHSWLPEKG